MEANSNFFALTSQLDNSEIELILKAFSQAAFSVVITDPSGQIVFVNSGFTKLSGYSASEIKGCTPRILKSGLTPSHVYQELWKAIQSGESWHGELLNKNKSGTLYWARLSINPIRDGDGEITHFIGIEEDITQKKLIEQQLYLLPHKYVEL